MVRFSISAWLRTAIVAGLLAGGVAMPAATVANTSDAGDEAAASSLYEDAAVRFANGDYPGAIIQLKNILKNQPGNLAARILIGRAYLEVGDGPTAEKELIAALRGGGDEAIIVVPLGQALILQHKYEEVLEIVRSGLRSPEIEEQVHSMRGAAYIAIRDLDAAKMAYMAAAGLQSGSSSPLLGLAEVAIFRGDLAGARAQIDEALALEPDNADGWSLDGDLKRGLGDLAGAVASYGKAVTIQPYHLDARRNRAAALIDLNRHAEAQADIDFVLELLPDDPQAIYFNSLILGAAGDTRGAEAALRRADNIIRNYDTAFIRRHLPTLLLAGVINFAQQEVSDALFYLEQYLNLEPQHVGARRMLASLYMRRGDNDRAVGVLRPISGPKTQDARLLAQFGTALMRNGEHAEASAAFERAIELAPDLDQLRTRLALNEIAAGKPDQAIAGLEAALAREPDSMQHAMMLGLMQLRRREYDQTLAIAEDLQNRHPDNPFGLNLAGAALWGQGEEDAARRRFEAATDLDPDYVPAHINLAKLDIRGGNLNDAETRLLSLVDRQLGENGPLLALANIAERRGDLADAIQWLQRVRPTPQGGLRVQIQLVDLHIRAKNYREALHLARSLEANNTENLAVLEAVSRAALASNEIDMAILKLRRMMDVARESPRDLNRIAQMQQQAGDNKGAYDSLSRAVFVDPTYLPAQASITRLEAGMGEIDKALARANDIRTMHPELATGDLLAGDVLMRAKRPAEAAVAYERGLKKQEDGVLVLRLYLARRDADGNAPPLELLQDWLDRHPDDMVVKRTLAGEYARLDRLDEAVSLNEELLALQPNDPVVLNNLAWLYQKTGNPDALEYAERAYALAPNQANAIDTLGWILVQRGEVSRGLTLLRDAQARAAGDPNINYHLAVALSKLGRTAEAREKLQALLNSGRGGDIADEAKALLEQLSEG